MGLQSIAPMAAANRFAIHHQNRKSSVANVRDECTPSRSIDRKGARFGPRRLRRGLGDADSVDIRAVAVDDRLEVRLVAVHVAELSGETDRVAAHEVDTRAQNCGAAVHFIDR